jgi:hypothetical protein
LIIHKLELPRQFGEEGVLPAHRWAGGERHGIVARQEKKLQRNDLRDGKGATRGNRTWEEAAGRTLKKIKGINADRKSENKR